VSVAVIHANAFSLLARHLLLLLTPASTEHREMIGAGTEEAWFLVVFSGMEQAR
jgi:hypothetical protein